MEYTIITPMEITMAAAAAATTTTTTTTKSSSGFLWLLLVLVIIGLIVCAVKATHEYNKGQVAMNPASPVVT